MRLTPRAKRIRAALEADTKAGYEEALAADPNAGTEARFGALLDAVATQIDLAGVRHYVGLPEPKTVKAPSLGGKRNR